VALLAAGCTPDPKVTIEYGPYGGTAYPNRAAPVPWPAGQAALVTNSLSDSVAVIDLATGQPIYTRPVGRNPVDIDGPHHVVADPARRVAFTALAYPRVAVSGPHASHGSALVPGYVEKLSLDDLSVLGNVRVENNPGDIVMSDDATRIVVSHFDLERATKNPTNIDAARADLAIVDPDKVLLSGSARPTFIPTCVAPHAVVLSKPSGSKAWVACYGEDAVAIVDLDDPTAAVKRVPMGPGTSGFGTPVYGPYGAALSPDQTTIAFTDTESKDVRFFDVATETIDPQKTLSTLGAPFFPKWSDDGKTLWVPTQQPDALYELDVTGQKPPVVHDFAPADCQKPHLVDHRQGKLFVVCEGDQKGPGSIVALDEQLNLVSKATLGVYPDAFFVLPAGFR
jgi:YVTN family beta-propeller protein